LFTADSFATPATDVAVIGSKVYRRWSPAATGINGASGFVTDPRTAGRWYMLTNWLDFTGMVSFTAAMGCVATDANGDAVQTWVVRVIPAATQVAGALIEPAPITPGPDNRNLTGNYADTAFASVGNLAKPSLVSFGNPQSMVVSWGLGSIFGGAPSGGFGTCRVFFGFTTAQPAGTNAYYLTMLAST
jgi:hypothetical protein